MNTVNNVANFNGQRPVIDPGDARDKCVSPHGCGASLRADSRTERTTAGRPIRIFGCSNHPLMMSRPLVSDISNNSLASTFGIAL